MGSKPSGISGSRGAAVLGMSDWSTPFEVWQKIKEEQEPGFNKKNGYVLPEFKEGSPLRWGLAFEESIITLSEAKQNKIITDQEKLFKATGHDFITCHIDGRYENGKLHEGKTTSIFMYRNKWGEPGTNRVPLNYGVQVQHQMLCTGADEAIISVLVFPKMTDEWEKEGLHVISPEESGHDYWTLKNDKISLIPIEKWADTLSEMGYFHQYPVKRNQELIDLMIKKYNNFWKKYVIAGKPPEAKNYDDIKRMLPEPVGTIIATDKIERWATEYKDIGEELGVKGSLKKRREQLKILILKWMINQDATMDEASREKTILMDSRGHKLISYNGKIFR